MRQVVLSPQAERDIESIFRYVATASGRSRADMVVKRLLDTCRRLDQFPDRGRSRDDIYLGLRIISMRRQATIAYTIGARTVTIQSVLWRGVDVEARLATRRRARPPE